MTAKTVDVTVAPESIELEVGSAPTKVAFSVTYQHAESLEALVKVIGSDPKVESWVTLEGPRERTFTKDTTVQIVATVTVPEGVASGEASFKLAFVGVRNPDEDYTESPGVRVRTRQPAEPPSNRFPIWILAVIAAVVIAIGVGIFFALRDTKAGIGEACPEGTQCKDMLACVSGTCLGENGVECAAGGQCKSGHCDPEASKCADVPGPPGLGQACPDGKCAAGLACSKDKVCLGAAGFACAKVEDCNAMACDDGKCSRIGQPCSGQNCGDDRLVCASTNAGKQCLLKNGEACHALGATLCDSQNCDDGKCAPGTRCNSDRQCGDGRKCISESCYVVAGQPCGSGDRCEKYLCVNSKCPSQPCTKEGSNACPANFVCDESSGRCYTRIRAEKLESKAHYNATKTVGGNAKRAVTTTPGGTREALRRGLP